MPWGVKKCTVIINNVQKKNRDSEQECKYGENCWYSHQLKDMAKTAVGILQSKSSSGAVEKNDILQAQAKESF